MKRAEIETLLPGIFRRTLPQTPDRDNLLAAILDVMELLHAPSEQVLDRLPAYFDAYQAPDIFVPYLAGWVDLDQLWVDEPDDFTAKTVPAFPSGIGRLRELISEAAYWSKWRGTAQGLLRFLETATGISGYAIDEAVEDADGQVIPFHVRVTAPAAARTYEDLVRRIIAIEKPAYVTCELIFAETE